jgi:hypothetical protein
MESEEVKPDLRGQSVLAIRKALHYFRLANGNRGRLHRRTSVLFLVM